MENRTWIIYALSDPRTEIVRYVGVTFRGKRRLNEHISRAIKGGRTHRDCWIRSLVVLGIWPTYSQLESGVGAAWPDREKFWIAEHRPVGNLTNHTDGGEGTPGYIPTPGLRQKWSKMRRGVKYAPGRVSAMLGKQHTAEARAKIAAAGHRECKRATRAKIAASAAGRDMSIPTLLSAEKRRGARLTPEHRAKIAAATATRKPVLCVETGRVFASVTEAARLLSVNEASVNQAIRKGCRCKGNHFQFA